MNSPPPSSYSLKRFLDSAVGILGPSNIVSDQEQIQLKTQNSLAIDRAVPAILYPNKASQIVSLVKLASDCDIEIYAVSRGRNIGYGETNPPRHGQVVISLEKMNQITSFDPHLGEVTLGPGVTQIQLADFLKSQGDEWIADVTGAPSDASLVGNTLDGGFGHTPLGNHREHILELEAVLGNGQILRTGRFPGLGPNLAGLFVQSNFGIVTSLRIPLLRKPERILTYLVNFKSEDDFTTSIPILLKLRQIGVIQNLMHVANATRIYMSTNHFPCHLSQETVLSDIDCRNLMKVPLLTPPLWAGVGGLYGSKSQVKESARLLKKALKGRGKVQFFSTNKVKWLRRFARLIFWRSPTTYSDVTSRLDSIDAIHGLCQGVPTDRPYEHIHWRGSTLSELGLVWISPVISASPTAAHQLIHVLAPVFSKFGFELPITMTFIDHAHLVCVLNLCFDKSSPKDVARAHQAYQMIEQTLIRHKIHQYRKGILSQESCIPNDRLATIRVLKSAMDPNGILAVGRYGIHPLANYHQAIEAKGVI